ncbi:MAG TPA: nicotinate-nucleotide--dimethylbenzimidazole phosphoribosyltransferase [Candidatus Binataceae bacterium]|nr:nicotinate-nucleotide--dimethylbenzimidazole phosphoribosyltransferase [Candidatus Binataceae bacterium]
MALEETLAAIVAPDPDAAQAAARRLGQLTKPRESLGYLEEVVRRYAAIRHDGSARVGAAEILVFVADHGVATHGVSAYPPEVTVQMLRNFAEGGAAICALTRHLGLRLRVFDVGVATDTSAAPMAGVSYRRIAAGTRDFLLDTAMDLEQAVRALAVGIAAAREAEASGVTLLGIGEMGIGNSTAAAALLCAITGMRAEEIAGRGTGLDEAGWHRKIKVIERALERHRSSSSDPLHLLAALGGFEIAAMAGVCLGGAAVHIPVVIDGFIATAAAAIADRIKPGLRDHLLFGHRSAEGGHQLVLRYLEARPLLDLDLRLGEGTGAALAISIIQAALAAYSGMATFASAGVAEKLG